MEVIVGGEKVLCCPRCHRAFQAGLAQSRKLVPSSENILKLETLEELREIFPGEANEDGSGWPDYMNWVFFGTSGVHGSYGGVNTLFGDDYEPYVDSKTGEVDDNRDHITVLVVQPRIVRFYYGHIAVRREDLPYLQKLAEYTRDGVLLSQDDSWPEEGTEDDGEVR
jgi:hypothetical protein